MSQEVGKNNNKVYKVVLTGGPCGGKTTGQSRLCSFFESIGWKVFRVPEAATLLMGGGIKWTSLTADEAYKFQENLLRTMMQIEDTFFSLAASCSSDCLVICDRGTMDATAYLKPFEWEEMKEKCGWNDVDLRDSRYNQVIHMISAADGAEEFYHLEGHLTRHEGVDLAKNLDRLTCDAWVGHPYLEVIDNSTDFERKIVRMIAAVTNRLSIDAGDRLHVNSKKRKFLVKAIPKYLSSISWKTSIDEGLDKVCEHEGNQYPQFRDFIVLHDYLVTPNKKMQARIRRRGQNVVWDANKEGWNFNTGHWNYSHTVRLPEINKQSPEIKMQVSAKEFQLLRAQQDVNRFTILKKRRCFVWNNQSFEMDIYQEPCHPRCQGLVILETYTTLTGDDLMLPDFLDITREITSESYYSMYNLSQKYPTPEEQKKNAGQKAVIDMQYNAANDVCMTNGTVADD